MPEMYHFKMEIALNGASHAVPVGKTANGGGPSLQLNGCTVEDFLKAPRQEIRAALDNVVRV